MTLRALVVVCLLAVPCQKIVAQPESSSPAARAFRDWLDVLNRGDRAEIEKFQKERHVRPRDVDQLMEFRQRTGGFEFKKLEKADATTASGIVKERASDTYARFDIQVEAEPPHRIVKVGLMVIPRPAGYDAAPKLSEAEALKVVRGKLDELAGQGRFSGSAVVAKHGKTLLTEARGMADRETKIANRTDTRFRIGSMNKMFTAVAVAQLAQAGKLKFEDPLVKHLPDYPNAELAKKVTIHHLLTHTGGTGDIFGPQFEENRLKLRTLGDYVALYGTRGLKFEPGSRWEYSNYGFLLLGVLVEKISGQSYYDHVRDRIFKPAGMTRTDSLPEAENVTDRAVGYMRDGKGGVKPNWDTLPVRGTSAGGGYSTAPDLTRFAAALLGNKLLDAEYTRIVTTGKATTPEGDKYAYGFGETIEDGVRWFGHGGGAPGMNGSVKIFPDSGYVIAVLSNLDPPAAGRVADFIAARLPVK